MLEKLFDFNLERLRRTTEISWPRIKFGISRTWVTGNYGKP
jgi:hypothetical protein